MDNKLMEICSMLLVTKDKLKPRRNNHYTTIIEAVVEKTDIKF